MADINVNVVLPNPISVDVTSPTQALATNVSIPGPQGPAGIQGPSGAIGPTGVVNTGQFDLRYYSITNPSGFISGNLDLYATTINLTSTGSTLVSSINSLNSAFTGFTGNLDATYATDSQLATTGSTLNTRINNLSGYINSSSSNILFTTGNQIKSGRLIIGDDAGSIVDPNSEYTLSLQTNSPRTWLEILNHSGTNKGVFFGIEGNDFEQYNWQAGDIKFFTSENFSNGIERLRIKNDGKIGIGTNTPLRKFHQSGGKFLVSSNEGGYGQFQITNPEQGEVTAVFVAEATINQNGSLSSTTDDYIWAFGLGSYGNTPDKFIIGNNSIGNSAFTVKANGNIGIGTNEPSEKLQVIGNIIANNLVYNTGNQNISGIKTFDLAPIISGNPFITGNLSLYATTINLGTTGSTLDIKINNLSGYVNSQDVSISNNLTSTGATLINNLFNTGSNLNTKINDLSGYVNTQDNSISINLYNTGSTLDTKINNLSGYVNTQDTTISNNLTTTGSTLDNKINSLSGSSVLLYGNQTIGGVKTFTDNIYINNLFVTGTETIVSTNNFNVQSPYILLNLTGGAVDGGIFFVTGSGLTGINDTGPIIGFDHSKNFKFGISTRNSDLSTLPDIASVQDIQVYSGVADNKFSTISNLTSTGVSLGTRIDTLTTNLTSTGVSLGTRIDTLTTNLSTTGSTLGTRIDTLTTNLTSTGVSLGTRIDTLSTNLVSTGSALNTRINNLSGYINSSASNIVFTTGNQTISGVKSFAQDTTFGDSAQGDFLVISGNNFTVYGSGNFTSGLFVNGNAVLTGSSTLYATTVNLASTGSTLDTKINNLSGVSVLTFGNQTISGVKTFIGNHNISGNTTVSGFINISGNYDLYSQIENSKKLAIAYAIAL